MKTHRMALFVSAGSDHGETRQMLALAAGLTRLGHEVDVVLPHAEEDVVTSLAHGVRLVELGRQGALALSLALTRYLARHKPCVLMSSGLEANLTALKAARLNRRRVPVVIHHVAALAQELAAAGNRRDAARRAMALKYPQAALVIGASEAITQALASEAGIPQANTAQLDLAPQRIGGAAHAGESSAAGELEEGPLMRCLWLLMQAAGMNTQELEDSPSVASATPARVQGRDTQVVPVTAFAGDRASATYRVSANAGLSATHTDVRD
ncbi:hypothetical protein FBG13_07125 [Cobetia marina]|uniref:glycosyltransferase family 4 protein n=1 Tax=Cobetia marina TaxID=28258 RepID=UPI0010AE8981|nr:glycosyltransferase family 4 protein [Cobetia marina]TKD62736.1 hypothetical protein FBG13_07125 [Cobetia marina]